MRPKYMLDTNICIYLMKHQPPQVAERIAGLQGRGSIDLGDHRC